MALSRNSICSLERVMLSASILACKCSTFRPPIIGKTWVVLCITYAIATAVICFVPTSWATFSRARLIFFSSSVRSQPTMLKAPPVAANARPCSPVRRRSSSSASVRKRPPPTTFHGASASPESYTLVSRLPVHNTTLTKATSHGDNLSFEIPGHYIPGSLIDDEGGLPICLSVCVCSRDDPSGSVRNTLKTVAS